MSLLPNSERPLPNQVYLDLFIRESVDDSSGYKT